MKRILAAVILLCVLLCACGSSTADDDSATPDSAPAAEGTTAADQPTVKPTAKPTQPPTAAPVTQEQQALRHINAILKGKLRSDSASIPVEAMEQYPELPTGCESVALTVALNALGCDLDKTDIAENYLIYDDNLAIGYCGDPFSDSGAGIWPPGIVTTVENYAGETGAEVFAYNTSGHSLDDLCKLIAAGCPVLVWTTYYMDSPMLTDTGDEYDGEFYQWYDNEHCVTLFGYDKDSGTVDIADPLRGEVTVDADSFEDIYTEIGRYSVVILDTSEWK